MISNIFHNKMRTSKINSIIINLSTKHVLLKVSKRVSNLLYTRHTYIKKWKYLSLWYFWICKKLSWAIMISIIRINSHSLSSFNFFSLRFVGNKWKVQIKNLQHTNKSEHFSFCFFHSSLLLRNRTTAYHHIIKWRNHVI